MAAIGEDPAEQQDEPQGDYSYDLAHEEVPAARRVDQAERHVAATPAAEPDVGGDYSYDLAHEVPPSGRD